ncbi:hypothetical protein AEAC466_18525 [Asticcacaulis sp. AC466]|uniref:tetratricopeptide repeat protein n=1 Tax=Asticcacaulis sp. AC466 TaxID=1282362 RepID=UPI0003C3B3A3|nr:tetratricopeptide repeat protein [Asticcacaulis sp. AC466]ESQ82133.1 hypothetical protein AEAC466_18525 [Asticcacaulis sp. AC466]
MKQYTIAAAALLLAVSPCAHADTVSSRLKPPATQVSASEQARLQVLLRQAINEGQSEDTIGAKGDLMRIIESPAFGSMKPDFRYWTYYMLAVCERELNNPAPAYDALIKAGEMAPDLRDSDYWFMVVGLSWRQEKDAEMVDAVSRLIADYPKAALNLSSSAIFSALRKAKDLPDGTAKRLAILEGLRKIDYKADSGPGTDEGLWSSLFEVYVETGNEAGAKDILASLTYPDSLMPIYVDKRYQRFVDVSQAAARYKAAQDKEIADARTRVAAHPAELESVLSLASALKNTGQWKEALAILDDALAKMAAAPKDKPAFSDTDDQLQWVIMLRSFLLNYLGRSEDALTAQIQARDEGIKAGDTVSQSVNLGDLYYQRGRPKEAIAAVAGITKGDDASPYGLMAAEEVRVCAYQQLGDQANLATSLGYMRDHAKDGYGPLRSALLCVGDADGLAKLVIAQLDDPKTRNGALIDLQTYLPAPNPTALEVKYRALFNTVRSRPDVQAAVDKYGLILSWPTYSSGN